MKRVQNWQHDVGLHLRRRGIATLWLILLLPALLLLLCFVIEMGNLWLARAELETALESAALAAVKEWGEAGGGPTWTARQVGVSVAEANRIRGVPLVIALNYLDTEANGNASITFPPTTANLIFGTLTLASTSPPTVVFCPTTEPDCDPMDEELFAVRAAAQVQVNSICGGTLWGPFQVQAHATARYMCNDPVPTTIRVDTISCP